MCVSLVKKAMVFGDGTWYNTPSPGGMHWSFMAFAIRVERVVGNSSGCCQPMLMEMSAWRANINLHAVHTTSHRSEATMVKLPCGSASTSRTFLPSAARPTPKFSQVVVLPVPPFWLTMAIVVAFFEIFITSASLSRGWFGSDRKAASWWVRCTEKRADIVSCYESDCCSLQGTSAQSGYGRRSAS